MTTAPAQDKAVIRDHGGDLDSAIARFGGNRESWVDLSTGINPIPYPIPRLASDAWTALPDTAAFTRLEGAARAFCTTTEPRIPRRGPAIQWGTPSSHTISIAVGQQGILSEA